MFLSAWETWFYQLLPALRAHLPCTTLLNSEECALLEEIQRERERERERNKAAEACYKLQSQKRQRWHQLTTLPSQCGKTASTAKEAGWEEDAIVALGPSSFESSTITAFWLVYPSDVHCCHMGTAINILKPSFVIFDIRALCHLQLYPYGNSGR